MGAATAAYIPFPSLGILASAMALPQIPSVIRGFVGESFNKLFGPPTFESVVNNAASRHVPRIAPFVAIFAALSLTQLAQGVKIFKTLVSLTRGPPGVVSEQRFLYRDNHHQKRQVPWSLFITLLSLVSLKFGRVTGQQARYKTPRYWGLAILLFQLIKWFAMFEWSRRKTPIGAALATKLISSSLSSGVLSSSQQRQVFVDTPLVRAGPTQNHTHGQSASDRNAGGTTAALAARSLGLEPYFIQQSLADIRKARDGDRSFHWAKDIAVPPRGFHLDPSTQAAVLVDVDYYIDMPNLLARFPGTYFIATFQPTATAVATGEYTYNFQPDGSVLYRVSGGAEYQHHVWDYRGDTLMVQANDLLSKAIVAYHIDRKKIDDHHVLIMLSVIGMFQAPTFLPTSLILEGRPLERLSPVFGDFVVLDIIQSDGLYRSVSRLGEHISVTMPKTRLDAVHEVAYVAKVPITPAMVASNIAPADPAGLPTERLPPGHAAILANYLRAGVPRTPPVVYPPSFGYVPIYFGKHDYDAPVPLAAFGSPLIGPCYGFATSIASDERCIAGRVEAFVQQPCLMQMPPKLASYMMEFVERLIPVPHRGHPLGLDEIYDHQDRPSQRQLLDEAHVSGPWYKRMWKTFNKKETYVKPTDPRNISTATPQGKLAYSSFLYAFHAVVMSNVEWYAFNKTPVECAARVTQILKNASHAAACDASRFDGHIKWLARVFERLVMLRFFAREHFSELNERLDEQVGLPGVTSEGRKYASGYTRASGSAETSDLNSVETAFIAYCGWRETTVKGARLSADQAWASLGVYGGDDSLDGAIDPAALMKSAKLMGQSYKMKVIPRGEAGVEFLNRQFGPDVWNGDANSMSNPPRLLSKLWVGPAQLRNPLERFAERASGYYRMDRGSPVIGDIVLLSHELLGERADGVLAPWDGRFGLSTNWPNEDSGWMVDVFNKFIPDFDWERFRCWIASVRLSSDPAQLLLAPLCTAPTELPVPDVSCVLDDRLAQVDPKEEPEVVVPELSPEDLATPLQEDVAEAVALVPVLAKSGLKQVKAQPKVARPTKQQAPLESRRPEETHVLKTGQWVTKDVFNKCPDLWCVPKYTGERLTKWKAWQQKCAKRLGIKLE